MIKGSCLCKAVTYTLDEELSEMIFSIAHSVGKQLRQPTQLMLKLVEKIWYCMEKRIWLPIVHLQGNNVIIARTVTVKFSLLKKIYQKSVL